MSKRTLLLPFVLLASSSACAGKLTVLDELLAAQGDGGAQVGDGSDDEDAGVGGDGAPDSDGASNDPGGDGSAQDDGSGDADPAVERGRALYAQQCQFCHAADGSGGSVNKPLTEAKPADQLASYIDANMPPGSESNCDAACASDLAAFILSEFAN